MTAPEPIVVTPEIRHAVMLQICEEEGHIPDLSSAIGRREDTFNGRIDILSGDENRLPYIICTRCNKAWLIIETPGTDYADAETKLQGKLKATDDLSKKITQIRNNRKNPKPPKESTK